jgi:acyl carrier protein
MIEALQPELAPVRLAEHTRLGEDLALDSLAFEGLFASLKRELGPDVPMIAWFNALEAAEGRAGELVDLIEAHERGLV